MRYNNYWSLINFKVKTSSSETFKKMNTVLYVQIFEIQYIRHTIHFIYGTTRMSNAIHLPLMNILHKIYRRYTHVDIIQRRSHRHI